MMLKHSSDAYDRYEEESLWRFWCFTVLDFLQNSKRYAVIPISAVISVVIAVFCIYAEGWNEYIAPVQTKVTSERAKKYERRIPSEIKNGRINIAVADAETLDTLYGIGEVLSERIIEEREKEPFHTIEDIMKVNGIGFDKFEKFKNKITLGKE